MSMMIIIECTPSAEGNPRALVVIEATGLICEYRPDGWDAIGLAHIDGRISTPPPCFRLDSGIRQELDDFLEI
jgi:hypothetical protein